MKVAISALICTITFLLLDLTWINLVIKNLYSHQFIGLLRLPYPQLFATLLAYIFILTGIYIFAIHSSATAIQALYLGALFGACAYGTYAFTNVAVFNNWPFNIAFVELIGGTINCGIASFITVYLRNLWL